MGKHISNWRDLEQYGINSLTGEACAYGMRQLCDLNASGVRLMNAFLGLRFGNTAGYADNWNSTVNGDKAIASIMLPREMLEPLSKFILFGTEKCDVVVNKGHGGGLVGYTNKELAEFDHTPESVGVLYAGQVYRNHANPTVSTGGRNTHQMSGRTT